MLLDDRPEHLRLQRKVPVGQYVSKTSYPPPVDRLMACAQILWHVLGAFANDLEISTHRIERLLVGPKLLEGLAMSETEDLLAARNDVVEEEQRVTQHGSRPA